MGFRAIGPAADVVDVCESTRVKHRQQVGMKRGGALQDTEVFQGGKRGYLLQGELREIDATTLQRFGIEKPKK
jgi:hypothetical protein